MNLTDLITIVVSIIALFIPIAISLYERNSKLKKAIYLKELIKTRDDLENILSQTNKEDQPILYQKIELMLLDINKEINFSRFTPKRLEHISLGITSFLLIFISMQLHKDISGINEGIFRAPEIRGLLSLVLIFFSFLISNFISTRLKYKNHWFFRIISLIIAYVFTYSTSLYFLSLLDIYVSTW